MNIERQDLFDKYLHDELSREEKVILADLLESDEEARKEFAEHMTWAGATAMSAAHVEATRISQQVSLWRRHRVSLAAAAALVITAGVWWSVERSGRLEAVAKAEQSVQCSVFSVRGEKTELKAGDAICDGMRIETGDGGKVKFTYFKEGTTIELNEKSLLVVGKAVPRVGSPAGASLSKTLKLDAGSLVAKVDPQPANAPMIVTTPQAEMTVLGTRFSVAALADRTRLIVEQGKVRMRAAGDTGAEQEVAGGSVAVVRQDAKEIIRPGKTRKVLDVRTWDLGTPQGVAFDGKLVWLYMTESATLVAIDPDTMKIVKQVKVEQPFAPTDLGASKLAWDGKLIWGWGSLNVLRAVDPETGKTVRDLQFQEFSGNRPFDIEGGTLLLCVRPGGDSAISLSRVDLTSGKTLTKTRIDAPFFRTQQADSMCCGSGIVFLTVSRGAGIAAARFDDGRLLYQHGVDAGTPGFFGGDIAYDPQRGLWCCLGKTRILLVEAE
ncbi:MAG: hypothetical protein C0404_13385 [Verrucomicrobia bacterium]|nr:hypothetical protein [Verrucomicrobiota bacterium]